MDFKNGFVKKVVKNTKVRKMIEEDEWKQVEKLGRVIFKRRNGVIREKMQVAEESE